MTEPVTPKADRRVIDGEVVNEEAQNASLNNHSDANARRRAHQRAEQASRQASEKPSSENGSKSSFQLTGWLAKATVWLVSLAVVVAVLFYTRPDQDWQIEHINRLQTQVVQLHETNKLLVDKVEQQQKVIDQKIQEVLSRPENQPLVSQGDLDGLKSDMEQKIQSLQQQLQQQLDEIGQQAESKWDALAEKAQQALQPSEQDLQNLKQFEEKVQTQLGKVGEEIGKLLDFKNQQEQQQKQPPGTVEQPKPLSSVQIQQWIVEINTQWLLNGNAAQTSQQLTALEQALGLSELANKIEVGRIIGEDLRDVSQYADEVDAQKAEQQQWLAELKALAGELPRPALSRHTAVQSTHGDITDSTEGAAQTPSKVDELLHKLSGLISLKKRESEEDLSSVDLVLKHDVLVQRLYLLIDRLEWALQVRSESDMKAALAQIEKFVGQNFTAQEPQFKAVLDKFRQTSMAVRKSLAIVSADGM
ncbi:hypothetical protein QCB45_09600 [Thiomicrorhabdus sp. ZW0627]|uniref:hypothetical protein n=1 Tax=Thiomicrorhabdus sp. ZW0627 TaxID=3039774 RepID=UPI0024369B73|nr:hypothetical protein [Thiomicrorhabdus sp. ZW0627]MDG6774587.1 hypothetical protein [Thiomicrorhabdus sp. ZW0627]